MNLSPQTAQNESYSIASDMIGTDQIRL